ncbi:CHAD domain protein [Stieleria maiorica]|uniref:CHAD domain protein n=1 Tax=Stieleria maiorica TaxID=2795974 RepID=A0A5B9MBM8_9BACT|nr:CHAD domain-containing protein [Stieleria maiorica]QEF97490.1 CHAD domain protein [Stieleria maiorica]
MASERDNTTSSASGIDLGPADPGKWIPLENARGCVGAAARITLASRLATVLNHLPGAGGRDEASIEHVHQLRVGTRRVIAALELYQDVIPRKRARWMTAQMKRIRRIAGAARDLDVLLMRYREAKPRKYKRLALRLAPLRRKARKGIIALNHKLVDDARLACRAKKTLESIDCQPNLTLDEFARLQFADQSRRFFKRARGDLNCVDRLHRFRIQAKRLRYTIELLGDVLPPEVRSEIYPVVCNVQDMLGELHDHWIARGRMKRLARCEIKPRRVKQFKSLAKKEQRMMEETQLKFHAWWTPDFRDELEKSVQQILRGVSR